MRYGGTGMVHTMNYCENGSQNLTASKKSFRNLANRKIMFRSFAYNLN